MKRSYLCLYLTSHCLISLIIEYVFIYPFPKKYQIYNYVYECESRTVKYQFSTDAQMKMTKEVKSQSCLYVSRKYCDFCVNLLILMLILCIPITQFLAFFVTYSVPSITRMFQLVGIDDHEIMSVVSSGTIASMVSCNKFNFY